MESFQPKTIYDVVDGIRLRLGLYIGAETVDRLESFLNGFDFASSLGTASLEPERPPLVAFTAWLEAELALSRGSQGWASLLIERAGGDGPQAIALFFDHFDKFRGVTVNLTTSREFDPPRPRRDREEEVTHIDVVTRQPDGRWFVWFRSHRGTSGCRRTGVGQGALDQFLHDTLGVEAP